MCKFGGTDLVIVLGNRKNKILIASDQYQLSDVCHGSSIDLVMEDPQSVIFDLQKHERAW